MPRRSLISEALGRFLAVSCVAAMFAPRAALADEPASVKTSRLMNEPGEVTNVVDAFDDTNNNPFDLHLTLGYQHTVLNSRIVRESFAGGAANPGLTTGGYTSYMNVAQYKEVTSRLNMRADIGVYKDIALYIKMPLILSNTRELTGVEGSDQQQAAILQGGFDTTGARQQLFSLPFKSPQRSGIEYLAFGLDFSIFNQFRDSSKPTWVFGAEVRLSVGEPMHACKPAEGPGLNVKNTQVQCADPSDVNRDGVSNNTSTEGTFSGGRKPGVSRGTTGLEVHSIISRRIKYIEPYGGFRALFEFASASSDFGKTDVSAVLTAAPPLQGWMILGMQVIPYEVKESFQRLTFDARFSGTYRSQGRDYTPLFDAIGSSDDQSLRRPTYATFQDGGLNNPSDPNSGRKSIVNTNSQRVYITGLTDTAAYGSLSFSGSAMYQVAEYVKFQFGAGYTYIQPHNISGDQPCNPDFKGDATKAGTCLGSKDAAGKAPVSGIPNPLYRPGLDAVGRRFRMDQASQIDIWINAVVMF